MRALKITVEGDVTSFRYPHFAQGVHPTYEMPPPATIYGMVCSAWGNLLNPTALRFAYHFEFSSKFTDYEHLHFFGKKPKMNPFRRELLHQPRLTLYLTPREAGDMALDELAEAFHSPRYALALGRSQDLVVLTGVAHVEIEVAASAFYAGTLLTLVDSAEVGGRSFAVTMPRFIDEQRVVDWGQYAVLPHSNRPVIYPGGTRFSDNFPIRVDRMEPHPYQRNVYRGVVWHDWT